MAENKKKMLTFTPVMAERIEQLKEEIGVHSFSAVVHYAVMQLWAKNHPAYTEKFKADPAERVRIREEEKIAKQAMIEEEQSEVCEQLGGKVMEVEGGGKVCVYFTYSGKHRYEQRVPLKMVSTDLINNQYMPSREKVEQLQKEGKTDY